jgi:hypothetical protein
LSLSRCCLALGFSVSFSHALLSQQTGEDPLGQFRRAPGDVGSNTALYRTTITAKIVLEDGSPLSVNPEVMVHPREGTGCRVSYVFRDGNVTLDVRETSPSNSPNHSPRGPGCLLWKVMLPGYQTASGFVHDGSNQDVSARRPQRFLSFGDKPQCARQGAQGLRSRRGADAETEVDGSGET